MSDIFLSYASADRDQLRPLVRALEAKGWSVFWDRKIPVGQTWRGVIGREITDCLSIVVVWTQKSVQSEWVMEEAEEGKNRRILFPVSIDGTRPPFGFGGIQSADFSNWDGDTEHSGYKLLIGELTRHIQAIKDQQEVERQQLQEKKLKEQAEVEQRQREEAERQEKADRKAQEQQEKLAKEQSEHEEQEERKAKDAAERQLKLEAEQKEKETKRKAEQEAIQRQAEKHREEEEQEKVEQQAKEAQELLAKETAGRKAKADEERQSKLEKERKTREEDKREKLRLEEKVRVKAEADHKAKESDKQSFIGKQPVDQVDNDVKIPQPTSSKRKIVALLVATAIGAGGIYAYQYNRIPNYSNTFSEPEMVKIPGGSFTMGCKSSRDEVSGGCFDDEKPTHKVTLTSFYLGKYEVTVGEYFACVNDKDCSIPEWVERNNDSYWNMGNALTNEKYPIVGVSWNNAQEYIDWLNIHSTKKYRLPSEAEWEYASRGDQNMTYSWGNSLGNNNANCATGCGDQFEFTAAVGSFESNPYGLYDMHGNVLEWVQDWYGSYKNKSVEDPQGVKSGTRRVTRGGSWLHKRWYLRSASRLNSTPDYRDHSIGFRVAISQDK